jgi:ribosome-associated protein
VSAPEELRNAVHAALGKKATDVIVLDVRELTAFTDYFLIASGTNQKQVVALADAIRDTLRDEGVRPQRVEGYPRQEWVLLDYDWFIVHVFSEKTRRFYDLERLWSEAKRTEISP